MGNTNVKQVSQTTVREFDADAYRGEWYEIASYQNSYRQDCENSIAFYVKEGDNPANEVYTLTNYCLKDGLVSEHISGRARMPNEFEPGRLKVKFDRKFLPEGDYWVYDTDYTNYSLVGDGKGDAFWILARTPTISVNDYTKLLAKVSRYGYDKSRLIVAKDAVA